jgi:hypothetical protein
VIEALEGALRAVRAAIARLKPDVHCRHCGRKVAEGSAHVDEDGNLWDAHWDCARRAELERRARDAAPSAAERSLRGRIGAYTRWANTDNRYMATRPAREGFYAKFEREVDPEGKLTPAGARQARRVGDDGPYAADGTEIGTEARRKR